MKVSVVTVVKEHPNGLKATVESLTGQTFVDWQLIIVLGFSKDETKSVANDLSNSDIRIVVIEQNSNGIYDAMNLGLSAARGDYIWFMNAGDIFFYPQVLAEAVTEISNLNIDLLLGGYQINESGDLRKYCFKRKTVTAMEFAFNRRGGCHQAMLFRRETLSRMGGFDTSFVLASDFDLVLKLLQENEATRIDKIFTTIEPGGRADKGIYLVHREKHKIRIRVMPGLEMQAASLSWAVLAIGKIYFKGKYQKLKKIWE